MGRLTESMVQRAWGFAVVCVFALLLLLAAYSNHFNNTFHFDDNHVIKSNLYIRSLKNIPQFFFDATTFSSLPANTTYRPLLSATFALDYWLAGRLDPWQFHVTQFVLLVLLGAGLVYLFLQIMDRAAAHWSNRYVALFGALFFCIHTANTETVNYICSRSDLLSTLGVVVAFVLYVAGWRRLYIYLLPMILGILVKLSAAIFGPLLFAYILFFEQEGSDGATFSPERVRRAVRGALPACLVGLLLFWFVESMNPPTHTYAGGPRVQYLLTQVFIWLHYLRLFFVPLGLTADTDLNLFSQWYDTRFFAGLLVMSLLLRMAWKSSQTSTGKPVAYGICWFGLALLPTSSIFSLAEVANEHRIFFPYIGLSLAVVWWLALQSRDWLGRQSWWRPVVLPVTCISALLVLGGHAAGTYQRNKVWLSDETLWGDVVQKSPANGRAWMNYGLTKMAQAKYVEAKRLFERAKIYSPNYPYLETNLGIVNGRLGNTTLAEQHFVRSLTLGSENAEGRYHYARWLVDQGRSQEAIPHLTRSIELSPGLGYSRSLLMNLYAAKGAEEDLSVLVKETLAVSSSDSVALAYKRGVIPFRVDAPSDQSYYSLGLTFTNRDRHLEAASTYRQALKFNPEHADAWNNLGWSLGKMGFYREAIPAFEKALDLRPGYDLARNNLAWVRTEAEKM